MKKFLNRYEFFIILGLAFFTTLISSVGLLSQYLRMPDAHIFVGVSHYWEDFYYYLDQFYQGAHGHWQTINRFSIEDFPSTLFYFNHILLGKFLSVFALPSFASYNISLLVLKFIFILLCYFILMRIYPSNFFARFSSYLLFLFSTNMPLLIKQQDTWLLAPLAITRTASPMMERFGNIPNTLLINIYVILLVFVLTALLQTFSRSRGALSVFLRKQTYILLGSATGIFILLSIADATKTVVVLGAYIVVFLHTSVQLKSKQYLLSGALLFLFLSIPQLIVYNILSVMMNDNPVYQYTVSWNIQNQSSWTGAFLNNPLIYIHVFGMLGVLFIIGLIPYIRKKKSPLETLVFAIVIIGLIGYHSPIELLLPIPRFRFLFSFLYVGMAVVATEGIRKISHDKQHRHTWILLMFLFISSITITFRVKEAIRPLVEPDFHFAYLPISFYEGLLHLESLPQSDDTVLAGAHSSIDIMIPGLTGKRTYSGHVLTTHNVTTKDALSKRFFFLDMNMDEARTFLASNNIAYVFVSIYDADAKAIQTHYPFLTPIFENDAVTIFTP